MKDFLISSHIDDELDLDEKIEFVETVHEQPAFRDEAVDLLHQEKLVRGTVFDRVPSCEYPRFIPTHWGCWLTRRWPARRSGSRDFERRNI